MLTLEASETVFQFNSDLSGEVIIRNERGDLAVSAQDILTFVAEHIRSERIARLEQADTSELLGLAELTKEQQR